jgi:hypothetical protein
VTSIALAANLPANCWVQVHRAFKLCENGIPVTGAKLPEFGGPWRAVAASYARSAQSLKEKDWSRLLERCGYRTAVVKVEVQSASAAGTSSHSRSLDDAHHELYIPRSSSPPPEQRAVTVDSAPASTTDSEEEEDDTSSESDSASSSVDSDESAQSDSESGDDEEDEETLIVDV